MDKAKYPHNAYTGRKSETATVVTLKIMGGTDVLEIPCTNGTTVSEAKQFIAQKTLSETDSIHMFSKVGSFMTKLKDIDRVARVTYVKGVKSFSAEKHVWPHPIGIIGTGYHGLKTAMTYILDGNENIVCFDRFAKVGGYCWITGANKTSRLQTEFGSFHVWWGPDMVGKGKMSYPNCNSDDKKGWHIWPYKEEILNHFNYAADQFGIKPHIRFQTNVAAMEIVGNPNEESRYYKLTCENVNDRSTSEVNCSVVYTYPGSLTQNRIIEYPGEDVFDGEIRYGMNDDTPYDKLKGSTIAILGQGAFAVENARTVIECGGVKGYIITRRKNLASPRIPSWFVHQGPLPTPGAFVLRMFEPMYNLVGFGDPWEFYAVHANADRTNVTVLQNSRFGIGDVTFLMVAWGLIEFIVTTLKRCSRHTLHLSNGDKLENVTIILKALGLLGDWSIDKLHGMKEMVGQFCAGDFRRPLMIDATGMNAANFTTFSTGIGTTDFALTHKYLHDFPKEWYKVEGMGVLKTLPRHKEEPELEKPAYVTDVKYSMTGGIILSGMLPNLGTLTTGFSRYKHIMYHKSHGTDRVLEVANREWDDYQAEWKSRGIEHDYVPYPYTKQIVGKWFEEWSALMKWEVSVDGPDKLDWVRTKLPFEAHDHAEALADATAKENKPE